MHACMQAQCLTWFELVSQAEGQATTCCNVGAARLLCHAVTQRITMCCLIQH